MAERLAPAAELAAKNRRRFPNESAEYRAARNALLEQEIDLRRRIEAVAAQRRRLPPGGAVSRDYRFVAEDGRETTLEELFGDRDTLIVYSYMFGPQREEPCPMCTSFMGGLEHKIADLRQRVGIAFVARSPIGRLRVAKAARGWTQLPVYSDIAGDYTRDYVSQFDDDMPGYNVFTRRRGNGRGDDGRGGTIRHFWAEEMAMDMADPGQDPRGAPDPDPLWTLLDTTPEGRDPDWYPKLKY